MPLADLGEVRLSFSIDGQRGSPVLLIMGFAALARGWENQIRDLAPLHRVASFDNRGVGRTEAPPGRYSMAMFAADAQALLDHLGWPDAHIVGVSMGGMIAQEFALRYPDRVRSLSLLVTHAGGRRPRLPPARGWLRWGRGRLGRLTPVQIKARMLFTDAYLRHADEALLLERLRGSFAPIQRRYVASQLSAVMRHHTAPRLHQLADLPTLVVKAGQDRIIDPRESDRLMRLLPHARLLEVNDAGHGVTRSHPALVNNALLDHFAAVDGG